MKQKFYSRNYGLYFMADKNDVIDIINACRHDGYDYRHNWADVFGMLSGWNSDLIAFHHKPFIDAIIYPERDGIIEIAFV